MIEVNCLFFIFCSIGFMIFYSLSICFCFNENWRVCWYIFESCMCFWILFFVGVYLYLFFGRCGEVGEGEVFVQVVFWFEEIVVYVVSVFGGELCVVWKELVRQNGKFFVLD